MNRLILLWKRSHIRPLWGLGFSTKSLLSSGAYGVHSEHILHYANWICREATATRKSSESVTAEDEGAKATHKM